MVLVADIYCLYVNIMIQNSPKGSFLVDLENASIERLFEDYKMVLAF